jgi:hypothetical protein
MHSNRYTSAILPASANRAPEAPLDVVHPANMAIHPYCYYSDASCGMLASRPPALEHGYPVRIIIIITHATSLVWPLAPSLPHATQTLLA